MSYIFDSKQIKYSRAQITEGTNKPDFVFPSIENYRDTNFKTELLTMLGLKTSAKDRWRQILPEADRIWPKHLITLEPAISKNQTDEMKIRKVQLVLPRNIIQTYSADQQKDIISLSDFLTHVKAKQS